jgi:hypothetical protein
MAFRPSQFMLLFCACAGAMIVSAPAQQAGRSITFSTPQNSDAAASAPPASLNSDKPNSTDQRAPLSLFSPGVPASQLPAPPPQIISPAGRERMKQLQEDQKNWSLMSPEEIFGVATLDQDASENEEDQNQVERYLNRQNRLQSGPTNGAPDANQASWNFSRNNDGRSDANWFDPEQNKAENAMQSLSQLLSSKPQGNVANLNNKSGWNIFGGSSSQPSQPPSAKLDLAQKEAMARFQELLEPKLSSVSAVSANANSPYFPAPKFDPNITQPDFTPNPSGASFTPLSDGISRPTGLTPLPGIVSLPPQVAATPSWAPQLPPWLSQGPQPFPQRKF